MTRKQIESRFNPSVYRSHSKPISPKNKTPDKIKEIKDTSPYKSNKNLDKVIEIRDEKEKILKGEKLQKSLFTRD